MTSCLRVDFEVSEFDCRLPSDSSNGSFEGFLLRLATGSATISDQSASVTIESCGLFQLSRSLIRLCTYPAMYGVKADESAWDTDFAMRSAFHDGLLELIFKGQNVTVFRVSLDQALRVVGTFNRDLLNELWAKCPSLRNEGTILVRMPDAFALAHVK